MSGKNIFTCLLVLVLCLSILPQVQVANYNEVCYETNAAKPTASVETHKGRLNIAIFKMPTSLNPVENSDDASWKLLDRIYDTLFMLDAKLTPLPWLAESCSASSSTEYIVKLKPDVKWHDGNVLTAEDVAFTYGVLKNNERFEYALKCIDTVTKVDESTVKFTLSSPFGAFLNDTLRIPILPKHRWTAGTDNALIGTGPFKYAAKQKQLVNFVNELVEAVKTEVKIDSLNFTNIAYPTVNTLKDYFLYQIFDTTYSPLAENVDYTLYPNNGTIIYLTPPPIGAKIFANYTVEVSYIKLDTNPDYFATIPKIDGINFYFYPTVKGAIQMLTNGDVNVDYIMEDIPGEALPAGISKSELLDYGFFYMGLNMGNPILHDPILRKALTMCVDKKTSITTYSIPLAGMGGSKDYIGSAVVSPANTYWFNATVPNEYVYIYDIDGDEKITENEKAYCLKTVDELLSNGGYYYGAEGRRLLPDGRSFSLTALLPSSGVFPNEDAIVSKVIDSMEYVGIDIKKCVYKSIEERDAKLAAREFDIFFKKYVPSTPDPYYLYDLFYSTSPNNIMKFTSQAFDDSITKANRIPPEGAAARQQLIQSAQGIIATELPVSVIFYTNIVEIYNKNRFEGWVEMYGGIGNKQSFLNIYMTDKYKLDVEIKVADALSGGKTSPLTVKVTYAGKPVENAKVNLSSQLETLTFSPSEGITDVNGTFIATINVPAVAAPTPANATVTVEKAMYAVYKKHLQFTINPPQLKVELQASKKCANESEKVIIKVYVKYERAPVADAIVNLTADFEADIKPPKTTTDKNGYAEFEFSANVDVYTVFTLTAVAEKAGYLSSKETLTIGVEPTYKGAAGFELLTVLAAIAILVVIKRKRR